jgi:hypothetical protein
MKETLTAKLRDVAKATGIPAKELRKLLDLPYGSGQLPRPIALKNIGIAKEAIETIRAEIKDDLTVKRKDAQTYVNQAFRLIISNLVVCCLAKDRLSMAGREKDYTKDSIYKKLRLTFRAVKTVTEALIKGKYIIFHKGSNLKKEVNSYQPTKKLELLLLPLIYEIQEEYLGDFKSLIIFKSKTNENPKPVNSGEEQEELRATKNHIMDRRSFSPDLPEDHPDIAVLRTINEYLKGVTYALKSPVRRIYSYEDPMQGGRLYTRLQGLPDRRARIRINTLLDGKPAAEVDLSANHARMLMALQGKQLPADFYDRIAAKTKTTRDQVKFLVTRAIGASNRRISLKPDTKEKDWLKGKYVITPKQRLKIENTIKTYCPELFSQFYTGMGIHMQCLEGDILLRAMLALIKQDIPSLPVHDAIYVQKRHVSKAKKALEDAWMEVLGVGFKPAIKIDES